MKIRVANPNTSTGTNRLVASGELVAGPLANPIGHRVA